MVIEMEKLREKMLEIGMTQEVLANKLKINKIHLNKVLKNNASLTMPLAEKIANIPELEITSAQSLLYPPQPLELSGQYFSNNSVELFQFDRLHVDLPSVRPGWYGIVYRGSQDPDSSFHFPFEDGLVQIFDSYFQKIKKKDERCYGNIGIIQRKNNKELMVGWLGHPNTKTKKHPFQLMHSTSTLYIEVDWCCVLQGSINLKALEIKPY